MAEDKKKDYIIFATSIFVALPLLLWVFGDSPERTILKEFLSVLSILAFCLTLSLFFLSRSSERASRSLRTNRLTKYHKIIGYISVSVLLLHPFFIVIPRYFEAGITPSRAFFKMITAFDSLGVVLGMSAWLLLLILGITSFFREKLPMKYSTWRVYHGILAILFIVLATWHALYLGRHTVGALAVYLIVMSVSGVMLILRTYSFALSAKRRR